MNTARHAIPRAGTMLINILTRNPRYPRYPADHEALALLGSYYNLLHTPSTSPSIGLKLAL